MNPGDAFGLALLVVLAYWIVSGNLARNGAGAVRVAVDHPRKVPFLVIGVVLLVAVLWRYLSDDIVRIPWFVIPLALIQMAFRRVEFREDGVFANPSFYTWDEVESAHWSGNTLTLRSSRRFVSPRTLQVTFDDENVERMRHLISEKAGGGD